MSELKLGGAEFHTIEKNGHTVEPNYEEIVEKEWPMEEGIPNLHELRARELIDNFLTVDYISFLWVGAMFFNAIVDSFEQRKQYYSDFGTIIVLSL